MDSSPDWKYELEDLARGASGGFLFGIPLLYTMEVWWIGSYTRPWQMILVLALTFLIVFILNRTDGFRQMAPDSTRQALTDSLEAIAIAILCTTITLVLLREITLLTPLDEGLGKVVFESIPFALGIALARSILSSDESEDSEDSEETRSPTLSQSAPSPYSETFADVGATIVGAIIIAFSIAPTDEIDMIAAATSAPWLVPIMAMSLFVSYIIVFSSGLTHQQKRLQQAGLFQYPLEETVLSYLLALLASALMLWFFHRLDTSTPWPVWLEHTLILGLPATVGGAAGRLAI